MTSPSSRRARSGGSDRVTGTLRSIAARNGSGKAWPKASRRRRRRSSGGTSRPASTATATARMAAIAALTPVQP